jgi:predicted nucleic-acid-binding protein
MAAVDTNVLIRFLIADELEQGKAATRLIRRGVAGGTSLFVPITVSLELEWVLRSAFRLPKSMVLQTFHGLLGTFELRFESESALEIALAFYDSGQADFADCLHASLAEQAGEAPLWTFDRLAAKVDAAARRGLPGESVCHRPELIDALNRGDLPPAAR